MSWSIGHIGTPEKVAAKLAEKLAAFAAKPSLTQSEREEADALPHIIGAVKQNFVTEAGAAAGYSARLISISASGSGSTSSAGELQRSCAVKIETLYGALL